MTLTASTDELAKELREAVDGEIRFDDGSRAAYSTDASNFRQVPNPEARRCVVEPGIVLDELNRRSGQHPRQPGVGGPLGA